MRSAEFSEGLKKQDQMDDQDWEDIWKDIPNSEGKEAA
jgi:hypothetical protein